MLSAKDAYKKTKEISKKECGYEISEVLCAINTIAQCGECKIFYKIKSQDTLKTLKELGYKVRNILFGYYIVSWNDSQEDDNGEDR